MKYLQYLVFFCFSFFYCHSFSYVSITSVDKPYAQTFNILPFPRSETTGVEGGVLTTFINNQSLVGWYAQLSSEESLPFVHGNGAARTGRVPAIHNYGSYSTDIKHVNIQQDRSLGLIAGTSKQAQSAALALILKNDTSIPIHSLYIKNIIEQWRKNTNLSYVEFSYKIINTLPKSPDLLDDPGYHLVSPLSCNTLHRGKPSGLDGNASQNKQSLSAFISLKVPLHPQEYIILRWKINAVKSGSGVAIDNLFIRFFPLGSDNLASPIRPLAQEHIVVAESSLPESNYLYTPSILRLQSGRLLAAFEFGGGAYKKENPKFAQILLSDDGGKNWTLRNQNDIGFGRLFKAGNTVYYLGQRHGNIHIMRSTDDGLTWGNPVRITEGMSWHQSACNILKKDGNIYLVMERRTQKGVAWGVAALAPVLMRARENDSLINRNAWTYASEIAYQDIIPGFKENRPQIDYFGIPFQKQNYPGSLTLAPGRKMAPMGWLETNIAQIKDPNHIWYDPKGKTIHLLLRTHTGGTTNYANLLKVVENNDGTMTTTLETAPSGKKLLYIPMPGGHMRFHILYDEQTKLYWLLSSQSTDSTIRVEKMPKDRVGLGNNERNRLVLHFSKNLIDWCFAGLVAIGPSNKQSRHYASMDFDGEDLIILSRSGDARAKSAHDGNLITFHRVKNFRRLIY